MMVGLLRDWNEWIDVAYRVKVKWIWNISQREKNKKKTILKDKKHLEKYMEEKIAQESPT